MQMSYKTSWLLTIFVVGLIGCSTSPPNLSQGLLIQQDDKRVYAFQSLDITANLGKSEFVGMEKVEAFDGDSIFPTYQVQPAGDLFCIVQGPWVLFSLYWNGLQPGAAIGLNIYNWTSIAYMPTFSFADREWYVGYQVNQKIFKYAALSFTRYEEQLIALIPNQGLFEIGPIKQILLNEVALNFSVQFDIFGFPMTYTLIPKYTWSRHGEIEGGGFSTVVGFNIVRKKKKDRI